MPKVILDPATIAKLAAFTTQVELCDEFGRSLGFFTPTADQLPSESTEPQISEEELLRREQEGGGRTLAEILADLENRS